MKIGVPCFYGRVIITPMNIDERLERLTERHEALTQSVEVLTHDISDLTREMKGMQGYMKGMQGFINDIAQGTARLLQIAQAHETRLDGHQERLDNLED